MHCGVTAHQGIYLRNAAPDGKDEMLTKRLLLQEEDERLMMLR